MSMDETVNSLQKAISDIGQKAAEESPGGGDVAQQADIARLQEALKPSAPEPSTQTQATEGVEGVKSVDQTERSSLGNRILDSVENMRGERETLVNELRDATRVEGSSLRETLELQFKMQKYMVGVETISKAVTAATRALDNLTKGQ